MLETEIQAITSCGSTKAQDDYDPYVCSLNSKYKKIAYDELREDDNIRGQALAQFREWIAKHPHIKKCRTDAVFLLRFLRTKKFSVRAACEMLEKYLTIRELYPAWFRRLDIEDPELEEIIDSGYLVPLLQRDENGRQILFTNAGKFDPYRFTAAQMARTHSLISEAFFDEEENQVGGYTYINDESGLSMGHVSLWSFVDIRNILKCIQDSTPMRHKETHFINVPSYAFKLIEFVKSLLSEKLRKRIQLHRDMDEFKSKVDVKILPAEYGGTVPLKVMIEKLKQRLREKRLAILALDDMEIEVTKNSTNFGGSEDVDIDAGVVGSFRKLEVD
jgi:hypothetical protein